MTSRWLAAFACLRREVPPQQYADFNAHDPLPVGLPVERRMCAACGRVQRVSVLGGGFRCELGHDSRAGAL